MNEMLASIVAYWDLQIFLFLNHLPHTVATDTLALTLSGIGKGGLIFILIGILIFIREEYKDPPARAFGVSRWRAGHRFFLTTIVGLFSSWVVSELILKPWFQKPRPHLSGPWGYAVITDATATGYSFPSSHAVIAWSLAVILSAKEPRWRWGLYSMAALISLSRVFLGVHFPIDIFAGSLLGLVIGNAAVYVFRPAQIGEKVQKRQSGRRQKK